MKMTTLKPKTDLERFPSIKNRSPNCCRLRKLGRFDYLNAQEEAFKTGMVIAPNRFFNHLDIIFPASVWTGTALVYEAPGDPFRSHASFSLSTKDETDTYSISFSIPKRYQGKKNCALVVEFPGFWIASPGYQEYELKVQELRSISLIEDFPSDNNVHLFDERFHIPCGTWQDAVRSGSMNLRSLKRVETAFVGVISRIAGRLWAGDISDIDIYANIPVCYTLDVYGVIP